MTPDTASVGFTIREYQADDFDRLWRIDQQCFPPGIAYTQMELSGFITTRNAITLVAEFGSADAGDLSIARTQRTADRIAGFVVAHSIRRKHGRILTLDIAPEARRAGLATRLLTACEQRLRNLGCGEVYLETAVDNDAALRLYRKVGYEVLRILPEYYSSHGLDAFQMGKKL